MLFAGTAEQGGAALRAMRHVATAGCAHPLSDLDCSALVAAHDLVFRLDGTCDPDTLPDISAANLAAALTNQADAEHVEYKGDPVPITYHGSFDELDFLAGVSKDRVLILAANVSPFIHPVN